MLRRRIGLVPGLLITLAASGCYLSHEGGAPGSSDDAATPSSPVPTTPGADGGMTSRPPDAARFLPPDAELPLESPREDLTCDSGDEELLTLCGDLPTIYVAPAGRADAAGTLGDPHGSLVRALEVCGAGCQLRLAVGVYPIDAPLPLPACVWISGGWLPASDGWTHEGGRSSLDTAVENLLSSNGRMVLEHLSIRYPHSAISSVGDLLVVRDVDIEAEYSGIGTSRASNIRVCRVRIDSGYEGISLSWGTMDAVIEDVEIVAGYSGVGVSWASSRVVIRGSDVEGGYSGVDISWSSSDVQIEDSTIRGEYNAVSVGPESFSVLVEGGSAEGCYEPISVGTDSWGVKVVDTEIIECEWTGG